MGLNNTFHLTFKLLKIPEISSLLEQNNIQYIGHMSSSCVKNKFFILLSFSAEAGSDHRLLLPNAGMDHKDLGQWECRRMDSEHPE